MSYIKCKSFITGKEVQYGLIEAELSHKRTGNPYGSYSDYYVGKWNTCPSWFITESLSKNNQGKYIYDSKGVPGITSRRSDGGILSCSYKYVTKGKHPIISNSVYDVDKMQVGENVYNLFETDNILVQLKCIKFKVSELANTTATYSFTDIDGSIVNDPYLVGAACIQEILKSNGKVIGELDLINLEPKSQIFPNRFSVNTELFCIDNFVPNYIGQDIFDRRIDFWYTAGNDKKDCKMLVNGEPVSSQGKFIGLVFSIFTCDYYVTYRNYYNYSRLKIVNSDDTDVDDTFIKQANTKAQTSYYINCAENNSSEFIVMCDQYGPWNVNFGTPTALTTNAESVINSEKKYKIIGHNTNNDTIFGNNFFITPILAPFVNSNYDNQLNSESGIYIPLTDTIYEGDPEEPVDPDEPETVEPADNPETKYTPSLPGDIKSGEETWVYPGGDVIGGDPGAYNLFRPSYSNFIFNKYYRGTTEWNQDSAWEFINDCMNASASEWMHTTYRLVTGKPELGEIVARVYDIPFEYTELFNDSAGIREATPVYGFIGPIAFKYSSIGEPEGEPRYYKEIVNRFYPLDLGTVNIQKVFNNYLDYTDTTYKLNLPYGAGTVELDPSILFNVGVVTANIKLKGYLDFDTGMLIIKVIVNNQLYYETSVNVAVDRVAIANSNAAVQSFFAKAAIGITSAVALKSYRGMLSDRKGALAEERYQEHRKQRKEDQIQRDAQIVDREKLIQENYNNSWFDRYYRDYELKEKLIDKQTEFFRAQTEAAKELMKSGFTFRPQGNMIDGIQNGTQNGTKNGGD